MTELHDSAADLAGYEVARVLLADSLGESSGLREYWKACGSLDARVRAEIMWDLLPVSTPSERESWSNLATGKETCDWLHRFWRERAQGMVVVEGTRIALHFRRLAVARNRYHLTQPRIAADMASDHGRAKGLALDDRGLLMVRMGEPDYEQGCPEEVPTPPDTTFINRLGVCWVYTRPPFYRLYYMTPRDRHGWNLPDGDYRIQESFGQQAEPGTLLFQKYVMGSDLSSSAKRGLVRRGPVSRVSRRALLDPRSEPAFRELAPGTFDSVENRQYFQEIKLAARRNTSAALEHIPDAPAISITADMLFETLRFLNPSTAEWQVWLVGAVPAGQLARSDGVDSSATLDVSGRISTLQYGDLRIQEIERRSIPAQAVPANAGISVRGVISARPGYLPISFLVEDLNARGTGAWVHDTINIPAVGGLPKVSDIAIAQVEGGAWTRDGETFLQVTPAHITNHDGSIHSYFEVYGVRGGRRYEVEVRLAPVDVADRIWRVEPDDLGFRLQFGTEMPGDIGRHHLRLDLSDTEPGQYTLAVRIQDEQTKAYSLPAVTDIFVARTSLPLETNLEVRHDGRARAGGEE